MKGTLLLMLLLFGAFAQAKDARASADLHEAELYLSIVNLVELVLEGKANNIEFEWHDDALKRLELARKSEMHKLSPKIRQINVGLANLVECIVAGDYQNLQIPLKPDGSARSFSQLSALEKGNALSSYLQECREVVKLELFSQLEKKQDSTERR